MSFTSTDNFKAMKYFILIFLVAGVLSVQAQQKPSLKDLLYSGKLKKDSTGVIRSTDDLSTKIDTSTKKEAEPIKAIPATTKTDSSVQALPTGNTSEGVKDTMVKDESTGVEPAATPAPPVAALPAKTNTKLWKEYLDSLTTVLKAEVLKSKQVKKETYYVSIDYEIGLDGQVTMVNVTTTPENKFLQAQIKQLLDSTPLLLNPVLDSAKQPRKVKRKQNFMVEKD
jgi:hypothetical protein